MWAKLRQKSQKPERLKIRKVSYLYRAAQLIIPCYIPILGRQKGAGRTGLTRLQKYNFMPIGFCFF